MRIVDTHPHTHRKIADSVLSLGSPANYIAYASGSQKWKRYIGTVIISLKYQNLISTQISKEVNGT